MTTPTKQQENDDSSSVYAMIDVEDLIFQCVPGGKTCDPQEVADNIREYCKTRDVSQ